MITLGIHGIETFIEISQIERKIKNCDLIITAIAGDKPSIKSTLGLSILFKNSLS